jgi:hypothetical protein
MRNLRIVFIVAFFCSAVACSPRDFLTRRLAADLIAGSESFKTAQLFWLRTGIISNKDFFSPEYLVLQRHGWITGVNIPCAPGIAPPPCSDVALTPIGIETFRGLIPNNAPPSQYFSVPVARRELNAITGIVKNGNFADVEFQWRWAPLNEVGAALHAGGVRYNSTVAFKHYDDGWRLVESSASKSNETLDEALKNAQPVQ